MLTRTLSLAGLLALLSVTPQAQQVIVTDLADVLPAEALAALESPKDVQTVFPVSAEERFEGQYLFADQIVFSEGGHLVLESVDAPFVLIATRSLKFEDPDAYSRISFARPDLAQPPQASGGADGPDGSGRNGRHGRPGADGQPGSTGRTGTSHSLPDLYIYTQSVEAPQGSPPFVSLAVLGAGIDGGPGGQGWNGGDGGDGFKGRDASSGLVQCNWGGGDGGDGGDAGRGGRGGAGGAGGDGLDLRIIGPRAVADVLSYTRVLNVGGFGGRGGAPGQAGTTGDRGGMGRGEGHCGGGRSGRDGRMPSPADLGRGPDGADGVKGTFELVVPASAAAYLDL